MAPKSKGKITKSLIQVQVTNILICSLKKKKVSFWHMAKKVHQADLLCGKEENS